MIKGYVEHSADFVIFAEVSNYKLGMVHALLSFQVKDVHATEVRGSVANSRRGHLVDAHFGEEGG
jgi:hypothetical protein